MSPRPPRNAPASGPILRPADTASAAALDIQIDERRGVVEIRDPRAFRAGRRGFCRRLLEASAEHPDLVRAGIDLRTATIRAEFDPRSSTSDSMAIVITEAIRRAAARPARDQLSWWRRPEDWSALKVRRTPDGVSWWEALDDEPARVRIRHPALPGDRERRTRLTEALSAMVGVEAYRLSRRTGTLTVWLRPGTPLDGPLLDEVERALHACRTASPVLHRIDTDRPEAEAVEVAHGWRRLRYLALAGGSFTMTIVGFVIPGVPTVPFLLATGYYLARSSPRLNAMLRCAPTVGPVLVEWEEHGGVSRGSKTRLIGLTAVILLITIAVSAGSPVALIVVLVLATIGTFGIAMMPGIPGEPPAPTAALPAPRLVLPAR